jgi:hypothetical protein
VVPAIITPEILELALTVAVVPTFHQTFTAELGEFITVTEAPVPIVSDVPTLNIQMTLAFPAASSCRETPGAMVRVVAAV